MRSKHKIPLENGKYLRDIWLNLEDGGSVRWLWAAVDGPFGEGSLGTEFFFVEIMDMEEYCGAMDAEDAFGLTVSIVNLVRSATSLRLAASYVGLELPVAWGEDPVAPLQLAHALHEYGAKAPVHYNAAGEPLFNLDEESSEFLRLLDEGIRFAEDELFPKESRERHLDKVVNNLGQTARDYSIGTQNLWDTLRKIRDNPNATPDQKLVLEMYKKSGTTLGAGPVPEDLKE